MGTLQGYNFVMSSSLPVGDTSSHSSSEILTLQQVLSPREVTLPGHNLPLAASPLIGRQDALRTVLDCLRENRLVTVVGLGGVGKSRLALEAAWQSLESYPQGVFWVALEAVGQPDALVKAMANAMGFRFYSADDPRKQFLDYLRNRQILLLLDNFEHLLAAADWLPDVLQRAPGVRLLCTSRQRLGLYEEVVYELGGLSLPEECAPGEIEDSQAVQLFLQVARRISAELVLTPNDLAQIGRICCLVSGLPLALEMAAAWVRVLSYPEIAEQIERSVNFLDADWRNLPKRHRSLRAVCEHSWSTMDEVEQGVMARLSVFHGSFQRQAAERVAAATLDVLKALVDRSMLHWDVENGRYELHPLLRQYAAEQLAQQPGDVFTANETHCGYYMDFLGQRLSGLMGHREVDALNEIAAELENIRSAWPWAIEHQKVDELNRGMRALCYFFSIRCYFYEGERFFLDAVEKLRDENPSERCTYIIAKLNACRAAMLSDLGRYHQAATLLEDSLSILERQGLSVDLANCLHELAVVTFYIGEREQCQEFAERMLSLAQDSHLPFYEANALILLGCVHYYHQEFSSCEALYRQSLQIFSKIGNISGQAMILMNLGAYFGEQRGDYQAMRRYQEQALPLYESLQYLLYCAAVYNNLAFAAMNQGEISDAIHYCKKALPIAQQTGSLLLETIVLENLSRCYCDIGYYELAIISQEQTLVSCQKMDNPLRHVTALINLSNFSSYLKQYERSLEYSYMARDIGETIQDSSCISEILLNRARALLALGHSEEALRFFLEAHEIHQTLKQEHLMLKSNAHLAHYYFELGQLSEALLFAEAVLALFDINDLDIHQYRWWVYQILRANNDSRAYTILEDAHQKLLEQADRISDEGHRRSFLENVKAHHAILAEWERFNASASVETVETISAVQLTPRELDVLQQIASGLSNKEIATSLALSLGTVKLHTSRIYKKLGVPGRLQAVDKARQQGLI